MKLEAMYSVALMVAAMVLLVNQRAVYASEMDDRIESSARQSYVFKPILRMMILNSIQGRRCYLEGIVAMNSTNHWPRRLGRPARGDKCGQQAGTQRRGPTANSDAWLRTSESHPLVHPERERNQV